jgi:hypothetical protein
MAKLLHPVPLHNIELDPGHDLFYRGLGQLLEPELALEQVDRLGGSDRVSELATDVNDIVDVSRPALPLIECAGLLGQDLVHRVAAHPRWR